MDGHGWTEVQDPSSGRAYFYHAETGRSEWIRPAEMDATDDGGGDAVDHGWVEVEDAASGRTYFYHAATGRSEWTRPAEMGTSTLAAPGGGGQDALDGRGGGDAVDHGWAEVEDAASGRTYYWHASTGRSEWSRPAEMDQEPAAATLAERDEASDAENLVRDDDVSRAEQHAARDGIAKDATPWLKFPPPRTLLKCQIGSGSPRSCWMSLDVNSSELCCETRAGDEVTMRLSSGAEVTIPSPLEQPLAHCLEVREAPLSHNEREEPKRWRVFARSWPQLWEWFHAISALVKQVEAPKWGPLLCDLAEEFVRRVAWHEMLSQREDVLEDAAEFENARMIGRHRDGPWTCFVNDDEIRLVTAINDVRVLRAPAERTEELFSIAQAPVAVRVRKTQIVSLTSVRLHVEADDAWEVVDDEGLISTTAWQRGNLRVDGTRARLTWESFAETRDFCLDEQWEAALEAVDSVPCLKLCCDSDVIIRASAASFEELLRWLTTLAHLKIVTRGCTPSELSQLEVASKNQPDEATPGALDGDSSAALSKVAGEVERKLREIGVQEDWLAGIPEASVLRTHRVRLSNLNKQNHERLLKQMEHEEHLGSPASTPEAPETASPGPNPRTFGEPSHQTSPTRATSLAEWTPRYTQRHLSAVISSSMLIEHLKTSRSDAPDTPVVAPTSPDISQRPTESQLRAYGMMVDVLREQPATAVDMLTHLPKPLRGSCVRAIIHGVCCRFSSDAANLVTIVRIAAARCAASLSEAGMISLLLTANHADSHPSFAVLRELLSAVAERSDVVAYAERVLNFVQDHELEERGAGPQKFALRIVISIMQSLHDNIDSVPAVLAGVCQALRDTLFVPELQEASATRFFSSEHFLVEAILVSYLPAAFDNDWRFSLRPSEGAEQAKHSSSGNASKDGQHSSWRTAVLTHTTALLRTVILPAVWASDISLQQRGALASLQVVLRNCMERIHALPRVALSASRPEQMMDRVVMSFSDVRALHVALHLFGQSVTVTSALPDESADVEQIRLVLGELGDPSNHPQDDEWQGFLELDLKEKSSDGSSEDLIDECKWLLSKARTLLQVAAVEPDHANTLDEVSASMVTRAVRRLDLLQLSSLLEALCKKETLLKALLSEEKRLSTALQLAHVHRAELDLQAEHAQAHGLDSTHDLVKSRQTRSLYHQEEHLELKLQALSPCEQPAPEDSPGHVRIAPTSPLAVLLTTVFSPLSIAAQGCD